jgi:hypothetical protein
MDEKHILVRVATTSGIFPSTGFKKESDDQKVEVILKEAAKELKISNTEGWFAKVDGKDINPNLSYEQNGLKGEITIDYGKKHGGGGADA